MSEDRTDELRPAYRTLNDPSRLFGLAFGGWIAVIVSGGLGYAWLMLSPLGWRANISMVIVGLGAPVALLLLRESSTVSPGRLLIAVVRWRARSAVIVDDEVRRGGVRLDVPTDGAGPERVELELPWLREESEATQ